MTKCFCCEKKAKTWKVITIDLCKDCFKQINNAETEKLKKLIV